MTSQKGFTLIEILIVSAIIGILAAIAIPSYMSYIGRAQLTEGFQVTSSLRSEVGAWVWEYKQFPDSVAVAPTGYIGRQANSLQGKYIKNQSVRVSADTGVISVEFANGVLANKTLFLTPTIHTQNQSQVIQWQCSGSVGDYLPRTCQ